ALDDKRVGAGKAGIRAAHERVVGIGRELAGEDSGGKHTGVVDGNGPRSGSGRREGDGGGCEPGGVGDAGGADRDGLLRADGWRGGVEAGVANDADAVRGDGPVHGVGGIASHGGGELLSLRGGKRDTGWREAYRDGAAGTGNC